MKILATIIFSVFFSFLAHPSTAGNGETGKQKRALHKAKTELKQQKIFTGNYSNTNLFEQEQNALSLPAPVRRKKMRKFKISMMA